MNPTTKYCRKCLYTKPVELFSKGKNTKDGYQSICKSCWKLMANNLPIKQNPDIGYGEFNGKIIQVNDEAIVIDKLTPEEEDKLIEAKVSREVKRQTVRSLLSGS
jgi:superfamily II helicase